VEGSEGEWVVRQKKKKTKEVKKKEQEKKNKAHGTHIGKEKRR
jgi:hypothetical protein